MMHQ
ncbi:UNVERIFIED_CONTAM: hypothetical protein GTU68_021324 [Idotea baltica]